MKYWIILILLLLCGCNDNDFAPDTIIKTNILIEYIVYPKYDKQVCVKFPAIKQYGLEEYDDLIFEMDRLQNRLKELDGLIHTKRNQLWEVESVMNILNRPDFYNTIFNNKANNLINGNTNDSTTTS